MYLTRSARNRISRRLSATLADGARLLLARKADGMIASIGDDVTDVLADSKNLRSMVRAGIVHVVTGDVEAYKANNFPFRSVDRVPPKPEPEEPVVLALSALGPETHINEIRRSLSANEIPMPRSASKEDLLALAEEHQASLDDALNGAEEPEAPEGDQDEGEPPEGAEEPDPDLLDAALGAVAEAGLAEDEEALDEDVEEALEGLGDA